MTAPYRQAPPPRRAREGASIDPWFLALLFAWVCGIARVGVLVIDRRPAYLEIAFVALLAAVSLIVVASRFTARRAPRAPSARARRG